MAELKRLILNWLLKKERIIESMTKIQVGSKIIRVWRNEPALQASYNNSDLINLCHELSGFPIDSVASVLAEAPRVNAVEVLNEDGSGVLIYPAWP